MQNTNGYNIVMRRTDLMDTAEWAHVEMVRRLREMTPEQRLHIVLDRVELGLSIDGLATARQLELLRDKK